VVPDAARISYLLAGILHAIPMIDGLAVLIIRIDRFALVLPLIR